MNNSKLTKPTFRSFRKEDLTKGQLANLPSPTDVEKYNQVGWHITPSILPHELLDAATSGYWEFHAGSRDWELQNTERIANDNAADEKSLLNNEMISLQKVEFNQLVNYPMIAATAAILAGTNSVRMFADGVLCKQPTRDSDPGVIGWHADRVYWPTCTSHKMLTAWIPFQDCTVDMGPVFHISESHQWINDLRFRKFFNAGNQDLGDLNDFLNREKPGHQRVPMTLKKGQVAFHHGYTIHASRPNTSNVNRIALALHFQDEDNYYQKAYREDGRLIEIGYDRVCRKDALGQPDYHDPQVFPELFRFD